ncbi:MAG: hypothetical protein FWD69_12115 [Polyangiaceae bacterium]|nr:hypothetical protein [Polyangiaceae bacterium]
MAPKPSAVSGSVDPPRNFTIPMSERIRAMTIGVPAYAARKRRIEDAEERMLGMMIDLARALAEAGVAESERRTLLRAQAEACIFTKLNELITKHNRYYPVEANLAMDRTTGNYLLAGKPWRPTLPWTGARLFEVTWAWCEESRNGL